MGNRTNGEKKVEEPADEEPEEEIDYGATADGFFGATASDDEEEGGDSEEEENEDEEDSSVEQGGTKGNKKEDESSSSSSDSEEEDDDDDKEEEEGEEENGEEKEDKVVAVLHPPKLAAVGGGSEECSFDLKNLVAVNSHPLQESELFRSKKKKDEKRTIDTASSSLNEDYLLEKATEGCAQLIEALWQLPTERSDAGPLMSLPTYDVLEIPRALPPPPPKAPTKWEQFAKERGIPLNKEKRSRKVWDEATETWKHRHGYDKANNTAEKWPIMEVGANDDPYADPWEKRRDEKHARTEQNRQSQLKNQERAGLLAKGTTRRVMKSREQVRKAGKEGGNQDRQLLLPVGVPVDLGDQKLRGKASTVAALKVSQVSTASMGKFDKLREGEPERKPFLPTQVKKKRKAEQALHGKREQERSAKVLQTVLSGDGGVAKEKARKKGKLAKGVTAYDYEYDDGADNALFKKKKGKAGAGKNRKMTKKRIK
jgi:regulator of ribosome biosynthesis